ncbi:EPIDERMAL PATTERNING FACTOR-like protein 1 isoform X1 [Telopea speciosissima]|uniref:EPIDERMAL PATTERNING FACTOR-like protein 1 isoform X1 n=1 Tax=Telopea speciosissima TaxID=54955 RepID=UPI001CC7B3CC|nr:EPIDERMAL PATTERNING FACTOR-like protein 1 isoform X1 [Telopea speciosissima]
MAKYLVSLDRLHTISLILVITLLHHQLSPASCLLHQQPPSSLAPQKLLIEDKTRLGSTPPSCHNKCNECHPCTAVQVPTLPNHDRVELGPGGTTGTKPMEQESSSSPSTAAAKFPNYKPLGWKCSCGNRLFNP